MYDELGARIQKGFNRLAMVGTCGAFLFIDKSDLFTLCVTFPAIATAAYVGGAMLIQRHLSKNNIAMPMFAENQQAEVNRLLDLCNMPGFVLTPEIEKRTVQAGLKPIIPPEELGPVIGTQYDEPIHEWILARERVLQVSRACTPSWVHLRGCR